MSLSAKPFSSMCPDELMTEFVTLGRRFGGVREGTLLVAKKEMFLTSTPSPDGLRTSKYVILPAGHPLVIVKIETSLLNEEEDCNIDPVTFHFLVDKSPNGTLPRICHLTLHTKVLSALRLFFDLFDVVGCETSELVEVSD